MEDDEDLRELVRAWLKPMGWTLIEAGLVRKAIHLLADADVVILDMKLPNGSGAQVLSEIARVRNDLPVVVWTGWPEDAETALRQNSLVGTVLPKTCSREALKDALLETERIRHAIETVRLHAKVDPA